MAKIVAQSWMIESHRVKGKPEVLMVRTTKTTTAKRWGKVELVVVVFFVR